MEDFYFIIINSEITLYLCYSSFSSCFVFLIMYEFSVCQHKVNSTCVCLHSFYHHYLSILVDHQVIVSIHLNQIL
jgi:hypothetical protein